MPIKLIIFDLDGTLADTLADITDSLNYALETFGIKPMRKEEVRGIVGGGVSVLVESALKKTNEAALKYRDQVIEIMVQRYSAHPADETALYPGVRETLEALHNFKKAVISNKRLSLMEKILRELGIFDFFDVLAGPEAGRKPSPEPIKYVLSKQGVKPREAIIAGDSLYDIDAGKNARLRATVAVTYGYGERESLERADYVIDKFPDLLQIVYGEKEMERRREERYPLPAESSEYLTLAIKLDGEFGRLPALIQDFSLHGLRFETLRPFQRGEFVACRLSAPKSLTHEVEFKFEVMHSEKKGERFMVGGIVSEVSSELWFRVLKKVYDFIVERKGEVF
jgi:phosphoglycolate phosphatase